MAITTHIKSEWQKEMAIRTLNSQIGYVKLHYAKPNSISAKKWLGRLKYLKRMYRKVTFK